MVSLASMPESTKHSRSRNRLSQGFVTTLSTILAKGAVSLGATRPDLASEGPKKRSMVSATPACSPEGNSAPFQTIQPCSKPEAPLRHAGGLSGHCWSSPEQSISSIFNYAMPHAPRSIAYSTPDVQASLLATKMHRLHCYARLRGRQLCPAARAAFPHLVSHTADVALRISRAYDSAPTQVTAQGGCREGGRALLQGPHLFLQSLPLRESLWPALLQDHGCILLPIACRDKVCLRRVCIPLHTAGTVSLHGTPAPVVSTFPIADYRTCAGCKPNTSS